MSSYLPGKNTELMHTWSLVFANAGELQKNHVGKVRVENCIGFCQIPLAMAGPLQVAGSDTPENVYAPLATYEGTLVASCSRGCKAFNASGGIHIETLSNSMSRGPVFVLGNPDITADTCREVLGYTTYELYATQQTIKERGIRNGQFGSNVNTVNIIAAMFIATGQDPASTAEACWSHLTTELDPQTGALTMSLYLPSLPVGTIGGGTGLPMQREALKLLKCDGEGIGQKERLAGLIAAVSLALDASMSAAITNDTLTASHMRLGRGQERPRL